MFLLPWFLSRFGALPAAPFVYAPAFWVNARAIAYPRSVETRAMRSVSSATRRFPERAL